MFWGIRLWWARLWVRRDEFHWTLDLDEDAAQHLNEAQLKAYLQDLLHRRSLAHRRSLRREDETK